MPLRILREGAKGSDVRLWQQFLRGRASLIDVADGIYGSNTKRATAAFQKAQRLSADGVAGPKTLGNALLLGFDPGFVDSVAKPLKRARDFPPPPGFLPLTSTAQRKRLFGNFRYESVPTKSNPEAIRVIDGWDKENIATVLIPQLKGIKVGGRPSSGRMRFHQYAADQLLALWQNWGDAGLLGLILTYDGSYAPRFVRGSRKSLSNHAFGTAFDINARWNRLGTTPALRGEEGSVRELVGIANKHGFFWGGHYKKRLDGMHFEVAKLI